MNQEKHKRFVVFLDVDGVFKWDRKSGICSKNSSG
jgi:hypothetical protein